MISRTERPPTWLWVSLTVLALLSLVSLSYRYRVEERNRSVAIVAELDAIREMTVSQGMTLDAALAHLVEAGLTGLVVPERTFEEWLKFGRLIPELRYDGTMTFTGERLFVDHAQAMFVIRYPQMDVRAVHEIDGPSRLVIAADRDLALGVPATSMGIDPLDAVLAADHDLTLVVRHSNPLGASETYVRSLIGNSASRGAKAFLPQGDQVLGRRDHLDTLIDALDKHAMVYLSPEFARITGDAQIKARRPDLVVRLHTAQPAELDRMSQAEIVERFVRAGRERNIRMLLVRPANAATEEPIREFGGLLNGIARGLIDEGAGLGAARPFADPEVPRWLAWLIGLAAIPAGAWLTRTWLPGRLGDAVAMVFALACLLAFPSSGRPLAALAIAVAYPVIGLGVIEQLRPRWPIALALLCVISGIGGLAVAALYNDQGALVQAKQFTGVKVAHFLPIALVGGYLVSRMTTWQGLANEPVRWGVAIGSIVGLFALAFMLSRTGNEGPAGVSGLELRFRSLLENLLHVRPRTKEFLIGYPSLVLGLALLARQPRESGFGPRGPLIAVLLTVGMIGPTSLVNTLCHLHTPLAVGFARILTGVLLGGILGLALWVALRSRLPKEVS